MKSKLSFLTFFSVVAVLFSCSKENNEEFISEVIKQWTIPLSSINVNPAPANRAETGFVNFQLFSDNSIRYELTTTLGNDDVLSGARLMSGDPVTNGNVVIDFTPLSKFPGSTALGANAYGVVTDVRQSLVDSLVANTANLYFELLSVQQQAGIARGQLNMEILFAADVRLTGAEEVPPVATNATGIASLRLTVDSVLYSRITISNNELNDPFMMAHIHKGELGVNGPVLITLAATPADFNVTKIIDLDAAGYNTVRTEGNLYVNAHSTLFPAGKIRGQLRN